MSEAVGWARLHRFSGVAETDEKAVGWHLWGGKSTFPTEFGPGFRYLITTEHEDGTRITNRVAVVQDFLPFTEVDSLADAWHKAALRFGRDLGVGMSPHEWYTNEYNLDHAERARLFTAWTYTTFRVEPVEVGSFESTFTGWLRLPEYAAVASAR